MQPREIEKGDLLMRPDGAIYAVTSLKCKVVDGDPSCDEYIVGTAQKRRFLILYPTLPVLVKREVICGWPRCEVHCGKCMSLAEEEETRAQLLQSANAVKPQAAKEREEERKHKNRKERKRSAPLKERPVPKHLSYN